MHSYVHRYAHIVIIIFVFFLNTSCIAFYYASVFSSLVITYVYVAMYIYRKVYYGNGGT